MSCLKGDNMNRTTTYKAALYCRLSKDDGNINESMSVSSQKAMLKRYANNNDIKIHDYYVDDGFSGTNFERPSFKRMIADIEKGEINCVITKDLSRLGRNYLESGAYIEIYFADKGVRYIAINDGIDTVKNTQIDIMPFKNILNEMYAKDTSNKVKSAIKTRMKDGTYIGTRPPFAYEKDPNDKHHLIIDEELAPIVKLLFQLCIEGLGCNRICDEMMKRRIPRPSAFLEDGEKYYGLTEENKYVWTHRMVLDILHNPVYCGDLERGRRPTLSYKNDKRLYVPKENRILVKETHEGIVSRETFDLAQKMISGRCTVQSRKDIRYDNIFQGLVKCPDCGYAISSKTDYRYKGKIIDRVHYSCSSYRRKGKEACTSHRINARDLHEVVLKDIQYHGKLALENGEKFLEELAGKIDKENVKTSINNEKRLRKAKSELEKIDTAFESLYADRLEEKISERNFEMMSERFTEKQNKLLEEIESLEKNKEQGKNQEQDCMKFVENISKYAKIKELSRYILNQLIDVIYVYDPVETDGEITQKVEIHYKFIGNIK